MLVRYATTHASDRVRRLLSLHRDAIARTLGSAARRDERGGALIEFTILAPVFFLIVFGIIEWGSIFYIQNNMVNSARQAARSVAVQNLSLATANQNACNQLIGYGLTYTITTSNLCPANQDIRVQVTVDAAAASMVNYMNMMNGTLNASVTMRNELACPSTGAGPTATCICNTGATPVTCQ
jgi:Flp pilus assembly protein TadG